MLTLPHYHIYSQIYEGTQSLVYQGINTVDKTPVILKVLKEDYPKPEKLIRYRQEYDMIRYLDTVSGAIKAYRLENFQNTLVIVLEDFGGQSLKSWMTEYKLAISEILSLAIEITTCLGEIHAVNVIHKDINPSNIVWNPKTMQVKLIDFGIATRLPRELTTLKNPTQLEGTLAYLSPEQTGRMNRILDYRTDLYSLGVTFYELFTGRLPFDTLDTMELIHCHLAKLPLPPQQINADIPPVLSNLILRLLAKNAEERYQSAWGVKADLVSILDNLHGLGDLNLGQQDISGDFHLPQKLYGRDSEIAVLLAAFEQAGRGHSQMLLVAGYSGIGKTSLVQEIYKPITEKRGYFISGKFDQLQRNVPYSAFIQAFRQLVQQLLTESAAAIQQWQQRLLDAVGKNGQVIVEVLPEIELLLGKQPSVPILPPTEAQNRFNLVFQNFIRACCQPEFPLVIFVDDLQWVDSASLKLMVLMMHDISHLFLIGAYRDNEVNSAHPLLNTVDHIKKLGVTVKTLTLSPLKLPHIVEFLADTLKLVIFEPPLYPPMDQEAHAMTMPLLSKEELEVVDLANLLLEKTGGNPFFLDEFVKTLYTENLLQFDYQRLVWQWDLARIQTRNITDNVVELMVSKIQQLPTVTQARLTIAAALGNRFDLPTLATVTEQSCECLQNDLWEALFAGLVVKVDDAYQFVHDRIQQAAYSLIPEVEQPFWHWRIGQLLLGQPRATEERLFELVDHLNLGIHLPLTVVERDNVARLNWRAAGQALASTAYEMTRRYANTALVWLGPNSWSRHYELTLALHEQAALSTYLNGFKAEALAYIEAVITHAHTVLDTIKMYELQMDIEAAELHTSQALQLGIDIINRLGITLANAPPPNLNFQYLLELPPMTNPYARAAFPILSKCVPAAYQVNLNLLLQVVYTMVQLSVTYGNDPHSAFGYVMYGLVLSNSTDTIEIAYQFGKLGLQVLEKCNTPALECRVKHIFNSHIRFTKDPLRDTLESMQAAAQIGLATGDFEFTTYISNVRGQHLLCAGKPLPEVANEYEQLFKLMKMLRIKHGINVALIFRQLVLTLMGKSEEILRLIGPDFDETVMLPIFVEANQLNLLSFLYFAKMFLCFFMDNKSAAFEQASILFGKGYIQGTTSQDLYIQGHFYESLTLLAMYFVCCSTKQLEFLEQVTANQKQMEQWANHCPANYQPMYALVEAEKAKVLGQPWSALEWYEQAIHAAHKYQILHLEALSYELAANFYLECSMEKFAQIYLRESYYRYQQWGALAKVKQLENKYSQWIESKTTTFLPIHEITTIANIVVERRQTQILNWLDLESVMKASQMLSEEMELSRLLEKTMHTVIENAGAQRGLLILQCQTEWVIQAEAWAHQSKVAVLQALPLIGQVPTNFVNYILRTKQPVVLKDAHRDVRYQHDDYIRTHALKSLMGIPLLHQQRLVGIVYLENNLVAGVFTPDRFQVLTVLSSQMAISLENAQFVAELEQARQQAELARQAEVKARQAAENASQAKTAFLANVSHELRTPLNGILGHAQTLQRDPLLGRKQLESVAIIQQSGNYLLTLVNDVLEIAQLQSATLELQLVEVNLGQLLTELVDFFRNRAQLQGLLFKYQPDINLPLEIIADGKRLRQVLLNLLSNAIKFTKHGEVTFQVRRTVLPEYPDWSHFQFIITDTGYGIATTNLKRIFMPFEQVSQWQYKSAGIGLGLSLTKQLVELMGGTLEVNSQLGQGSTFTVNLDFHVSVEFTSTSEIDLTTVCLAEEMPIIALKGPSTQEAAELYELTLMGDFYGILKLITKLEEKDSELRPFAEKVRELAKEYQDEPIGELAQKFMTDSL